MAGDVLRGLLSLTGEDLQHDLVVDHPRHEEAQVGTRLERRWQLRLDARPGEREQTETVIAARGLEDPGDHRRTLPQPDADGEELASGACSADDLDVHVLNNLRGASTTRIGGTCRPAPGYRPMDRSLYVVASAMAAELARQQRIGNDLANTTTPGYKSEETTQRSFDDMLLFSRMSGQEIGEANLGVYNTPPTLDLSQGPLEPTTEDLDLAIDGDGWFTVQTDKGTFFTRNGQFRTRPDGTITTADDNEVLGTDGKPVRITPLAKVTFDADGTVSSDGKQVGKLAVVRLTEAGRGPEGLYTGKVAGPALPTTQLRQGFLEGAKLDAATTMIDMIVSLRAFEAGQRVIKATDETLQRAISAGATGG